MWRKIPTSTRSLRCWWNHVETTYHVDDEGRPFWEIQAPIEQHTGSHRAPPKILGMVHLLISTKAIARVMETFWKITGVAAAISVVVLILVLSYFLRKTVANERLLRQTQSQNIQLSQQLHEAQRQLMNVEKLAVMGQLTANFAHEIGTPLNAIGGHLQLLREEISGGGQSQAGKRPAERFEIINGELLRIEEIVKSFLQTTSKPVSQRQLVDINSLVERTLDIVRPRLDGMGVDVECRLDRSMGPLRIVPLDLEQVMLNLLNNSLDSLRKQNGEARAPSAATPDRPQELSERWRGMGAGFRSRYGPRNSQGGSHECFEALLHDEAAGGGDGPWAYDLSAARQQVWWYVRN